jgi:hypothetical protein
MVNLDTTFSMSQWKSQNILKAEVHQKVSNAVGELHRNLIAYQATQEINPRENDA